MKKILTVLLAIIALHNVSFAQNSGGLSVKVDSAKTTLDGCWVGAKTPVCPSTPASTFCFRNDSLIIYHNGACEGWSMSLHRFKIVNDTIVTQELESYKNRVGMIVSYHKNRDRQLRLPLQMFSQNQNDSNRFMGMKYLAIQKETCYRKHCSCSHRKGIYEYREVVLTKSNEYHFHKWDITSIRLKFFERQEMLERWEREEQDDEEDD